jgi:hypothetical protein
LDTTGSIDKINASVAKIAAGRKGLDIKGETEAGRISYRGGLADAMSVFQEAAASSNAAVMILVEHAFLTEEKRFCAPTNKAVLSSLTSATDSFDDALRALSIVVDASSYSCVDFAFPRDGKYRIGDMPKDAFHLACIAHRTRLNNTLKTPGLNPTEQVMYKQRAVNMTIAQNVYLALQNKILAIDKT